MKLFTVGPVEMYEKTLEAGGKPLPYFRTPEFSAIMKKIRERFLLLAGAPNDSHFIILTASGTGAMEAAVMNCLKPGDRALVIDGGGFGRRFAQICRCHHIECATIEVPFGTALDEHMLAPMEGAGYTALLVNLDETSTGQLYDIRMLGEFCRRNGMYFIVDAISSFLTDPMDIAGDHVDVFITSSQKALALPPGLSFIIAGERIWREKVLPSEQTSLYFDFKDYDSNMERGQTPFTPAVGTVLQLSERLEKLEQEGIEHVIQTHRERAAYFRGLCRERNICVPEYPKSNAVTPVWFEEGNAKAVFAALQEDYGLVVTPSGGALADHLLRVGHLGNQSPEDLKTVADAIAEVMQRG